MSIDPGTALVIAKAAVATVSDERVRSVILMAALTPIILILLVLSSPFAIFFSVVGEDNNVPVTSVMQALKVELQEKISLALIDPNADEIIISYLGSEDNAWIDNRADVLFVFSAKYNIAGEASEQMAVLSNDQVSNLKALYWDMNILTITEEVVYETVTYETMDANGTLTEVTKAVPKLIKTIVVDARTAEEAAHAFKFNDVQIHVIQEMRKSELSALFMNQSITMFLTPHQVQAIHAYLPDGFEIERSELVSLAESLVDKVTYFWGGKSTVMGWDTRFGTDMEVTSPGSSTTGTIRPFGLDCSGFVTWVFVNVGLPVDTIEATIGHGATKQWHVSSSITEQMALPGDLAFLAIPGTRKVNHVGIVVGRNENNALLVAHSASGANGVVITTAESVGFLFYKRPAVLIKH